MFVFITAVWALNHGLLSLLQYSNYVEKVKEAIAWLLSVLKK